MYRWSYRRLAEAAHQFARELETRGIGKGDRVLVWGANCPEWVAAFFGCCLRGSIVVPLDASITTNFVKRIQKQVDAKLLLCGVGQPLFEIDERIPTLVLEQLDTIIAPHSSQPYQAAADISAQDIVQIVYTSGTTSEPKGICLTHGNLLANLEPLERGIEKYRKWEQLVHPLRVMNLLTFSHIFGQIMGIFVPQLLGGEALLQDAANLSEVIRAAKRQRISVIAATPRLLDRLREKIESDYAARGQLQEFQEKLRQAEKWKAVRQWWEFRELHHRFGWKFWAFVTGGATLSAATEYFWHQLGFAVLQGYGMTETASLITINHPLKKGSGSIGKPLHKQEIKLSAEGEILVRGASVSPGYWDHKVKALAIDPEGWFHTGDLGAMDESGRLYFKGRKKEIIVTPDGANIFPEDLEAALNLQPEVRTSAVVGFTNSHGPEPLAVLILRNGGGEQAAAAVIKRVNERLEKYQRIRHWCVWPDEDFPRTPTQKIRKQFVAEQSVKQLSEQLAQVESERPDTLVQLIARITGAQSAQPADTVNLADDLNLDSLARAELLSAIESHYRLKIEDAAFTPTTTLGELRLMIQPGGAPSSSGVPLPYPYPERAQSFPMTWVRAVLVNSIMLPITQLMTRVSVKGREHLRGVRAPVLFVANHVSMSDPALVIRALPWRFRKQLAIAMFGEVLRDLRYPPKRTSWITAIRYRAQYALVIAFFNPFALPKKSSFRRSFAFAGETMDRGYSILVFPEGRRAEDGRLAAFRAGIGMLATKLNVAVVPMRIDGLQEATQSRRYFSRPGQIHVTIGAPIKYETHIAATDIAKDLARRVAAL